MSKTYALIFCLLSGAAMGQDLGISGEYFFATSVSNTDSTSMWYENVFDMKLAKEIKNDQVHVRIVKNSFLTVEMIERKAAGVTNNPKASTAPPRKGITKIGVYVADLQVVNEYFAQKKIRIKHGPFEDKELGVKTFIIEDLNGHLIQFFQRVN